MAGHFLLPSISNGSYSPTPAMLCGQNFWRVCFLRKSGIHAKNKLAHILKNRTISLHEKIVSRVQNCVIFLWFRIVLQGCPQAGAGGEIPPYSGHLRPLLFSQFQKIKKAKILQNGLNFGVSITIPPFIYNRYHFLKLPPLRGNINFFCTIHKDLLFCFDRFFTNL